MTGIYNLLALLCCFVFFSPMQAMAADPLSTTVFEEYDRLLPNNLRRAAQIFFDRRDVNNLRLGEAKRFNDAQRLNTAVIVARKVLANYSRNPASAPAEIYEGVLEGLYKSFRVGFSSEYVGMNIWESDPNHVREFLEFLEETERHIPTSQVRKLIRSSIARHFEATPAVITDGRRYGAMLALSIRTDARHDVSETPFKFAHEGLRLFRGKLTNIAGSYRPEAYELYAGLIEELCRMPKQLGMITYDQLILDFLITEIQIDAALGKSGTHALTRLVERSVEKYGNGDQSHERLLHSVRESSERLQASEQELRRSAEIQKGIETSIAGASTIERLCNVLRAIVAPK